MGAPTQGKVGTIAAFVDNGVACAVSHSARSMIIHGALIRWRIILLSARRYLISMALSISAYAERVRNDEQASTIKWYRQSTIIDERRCHFAADRKHHSFA